MHKDQDSVQLIDVQNGKTYECDVYTVNREINEKYIANGWYDYAKENRLQIGYLLGFMMSFGTERLYLKRLNH